MAGGIVRQVRVIFAQAEAVGSAALITAGIKSGSGSMTAEVSATGVAKMIGITTPDWLPISSIAFYINQAPQTFDLQPYAPNAPVNARWGYDPPIPGLTINGSVLQFDGTGSAATYSNVTFWWDDPLPASGTSVFAPDDSDAWGATNTFINSLMPVPWVNANTGDWYDLDGIAQGLNAGLGTLSFTSTNVEIERQINVKQIVDLWLAGEINWGFCITGGSTAQNNARSRRYTGDVNVRPRLTIVQGGQTYVIACQSSFSLGLASGVAGKAPADQFIRVGNGNTAYLFFDIASLNLTGPVTSATLSIWTYSFVGASTQTLRAFRCDLRYQTRDLPVLTGIAQEGIKDAHLMAEYQADIASAEAGGSPIPRVWACELFPDVTNLMARNWTSNGTGYLTSIGDTDPENQAYQPVAPGVKSVKVTWRYDEGSVITSAAAGATTLSITSSTWQNLNGASYYFRIQLDNGTYQVISGRPLTGTAPNWTLTVSGGLSGSVSVGNKVFQTVDAPWVAQFPFWRTWGRDPEELWIRFYIMFSDDWPLWANSGLPFGISQGKLPGVSGKYIAGFINNVASGPIGKKLLNAKPFSWSQANGNTLPDAGNGGNPPSGATGWTVRSYSRGIGELNTTGQLPFDTYGRVAQTHTPMFYYSYDANMTTDHAIESYWTSMGTVKGLFKRMEWKCVELHFKCNTPTGGIQYLGNRTLFRYPTNDATKLRTGLNSDVYQVGYSNVPTANTISAYSAGETVITVNKDVSKLFSGPCAGSKVIFTLNSGTHVSNCSVMSVVGTTTTLLLAAPIPTGRTVAGGATVYFPDDAFLTFTSFLYVGRKTGGLYASQVNSDHWAPWDATEEIIKSSDYGGGVGQSDGIYEAYVDGQLIHSVPSYRIRHFPEMNIASFWVDFYWGGSEAYALRKASMYMSSVVCASQRVGPMRMS